jgi:hypothetical protein
LVDDCDLSVSYSSLMPHALRAIQLTVLQQVPKAFGF